MHLLQYMPTSVPVIMKLSLNIIIFCTWQFPELLFLILFKTDKQLKGSIVSTQAGVGKLAL